MNLVTTNQVPHMGTFNSNPLCLAAAQAALRELSRDNGRVIRYISEMGAKLRTGMNSLFEKHSFPMKAVGGDPIFVLHSPPIELSNYRDFLKLDFNVIHRFHTEMMQRGVWFMRRGNLLLSAAHTDEDIAQTLEAAEQVIKEW